VIRTARHWGTRPSQLLGEADAVVAFALDEALAVADVIAMRKASEAANPDAVAPPDDQRFAGDDDYADDVTEEPSDG
jgi:hypothetical protein